MANVTTPFGIRAMGIMYGLQPFSVDSSNTPAIFRGDVIMAESDGNVAAATAGNTQLLGAAAGLAPAAITSYAKSILSASTAGTILVHNDPNQVYVIKHGTGTTAPAQTNLFNNADHVAGTGSTVTGRSGHVLDGATYATTAAGFRILDFVIREDNEVGDGADLVVVIMEHALNTTTGV